MTNVTSPRRNSARQWFTRALLFLVVVALLLGGLWLSQQRHEPLVISGFIEADELRLGSRVGGRVAQVHVAEGETVTQGQVLIELEPYDLRERRAQAEATLRQLRSAHEKLLEGFRTEEIQQAEARLQAAQANLELLKNGPRKQEIAAAQAELDLAQAELDLANESHARIVALQQQGAATQEALDRATKEKRTAEERVQARSEQLALLQEGTRPEEIAIASARVREADQSWKMMTAGYRTQEVDEAYAAMKGAESALAALDIQLEELKVQAPAAGTIEAIDLRPGDLVLANAPVISMMDTHDLWVRAYLPEDQLGVSLGTQLPVSVDSYPDQRFKAEVTYIARQAEFTPGNVQTPEDRSKQVFRIKVTLREGHDQLRPGMAADIWLDAVP